MERQSVRQWRRRSRISVSNNLKLWVPVKQIDYALQIAPMCLEQRDNLVIRRRRRCVNAADQQTRKESHQPAFHEIACLAQRQSSATPRLTLEFERLLRKAARYRRWL
ncbi:hypothetical protein ASA1KI_03650 [Opitutales bacterium ASA1]|nr:hypothetical protein ASA1KI_03650 [Opitutales bacterium ASA1]